MRGKVFLFWVPLFFIFASACSHQSSTFSRRGHSYPTGHSQAGLDQDALNFLKKKGKGPLPSYDVPMVINDQVKWWIHFFREDYHSRFALYLSRSGRYENFMRSILAEEGLPQDLIYIALIESGFSNHAYSRARAVGPWQFIRSTGRLFGLTNNNWKDERKDPEKATRAAAHYFKKLYNEFGDWYLAMAAYNAGEGKIHRAIDRARSQNFWDIAAPGTGYLRWETQNYVPKFIAAALIAKSPERFGFSHIEYEAPLSFDEVSVKGPLDLEVASELTSGDLEELQNLNPELKMGAVPSEHYRLKIPSGTKEKFELAYAQLPKENRVKIVYHTVRRGESLTKIAKRYGVSIERLLADNEISPKRMRHVRPGTRLVISKRPSSASLASARSAASGVLLAYNERGKKRKRVNGVEWLIKKDMGEEKVEEVEKEKGTEILTDAPPVEDEQGMGEASLPMVEETDLGEVKGQVSESQMEKLSKETGSGAVILKPRDAMAAVPEGGKRIHVVKRGENLWKISKHYGVPVGNLKKWNKLTNANQLKPGKKIVVAHP